MEDLATCLESAYQADGERKNLDALYDEWASDYDQQLWTSGNPLRQWVLAYRKC